MPLPVAMSAIASLSKMSFFDSPSIVRRPVSSSDSVEFEQLRFRLAAVGMIVLVAAAALTLRLYRLSELPPGLDAGEAANGLDALRVLEGEHAVFFPERFRGREGMAMYAIAASIYFLGQTALAIRLPSALASVGAVLAVFWLGRTLFGRDDQKGDATPWRGMFVGGVSAGLMAVSLVQTIIGRTGFRTTLLPLFLCLCVTLLWEGWRRRSWRWVLMGGVCAGLLPYTYIPARLTPLLFLLFGLTFFLPIGSFTRERVRAELPWAALFVTVTGLVAAPILIYFALNPESFFSRSGEVWMFEPGRIEGNRLHAFFRNVWEHLLVFGVRGDPTWRHSFASKSMLNPLEAIFFWLGAAIAVWQWQWKPAYRLLLLWLALLSVPAILAIDYPPSVLRMIGAAPAAYLLIGIGLWEGFRFVKGRYFQANEAGVALAVGSLACGMILVQGGLTYRDYFHRWGNAQDTFEAYQLEWAELARALSAQPADVGTVYLVPGFQQHDTFEYLYQGKSPAYIIFMDSSDLAQEVHSVLAANRQVSTVKVVEWNYVNRWVEDDIGRFDFLLTKYGRRAGSEEHGDFQLHNYADIHLNPPWAFHEQLEPLEIRYDGGIVLRGAALGQDEDQLPTEEVALARGHSMWGVLEWQIDPGLEIDYAISLRIYDGAGMMVRQEDSILWKATNHTPTSHWAPDEKVETLFRLGVPAELQPGYYELRLVVYDFETQTPTVQQEVWEPEVTLARLRLLDGDP